MDRKGIHLAAIFLALMLLGSTCLALDNQIINGEFDAGTVLWQRYGNDAYTIEVVQDAGLSGPNALKIDIFDAAAQESITVAQGGLVLKQGTTYQIGFLAKAEADRQMRVLLRQADTGVDAWHDWVNLTTFPQNFSFEYIHVNTTMENMILYFILKNPSFPLPGENENIAVYIDGIYLSKKPPPDPNRAHYPWPFDGAIHNSRRVTLSWSPGRYAMSHNVYFGDSYDEVSNGTGNTFVRNQSTTDLVISYSGDLKITLVPGTTYYWRIDEIDYHDPDRPWKGNVWSFTIPPYTAYDPDPPDSATYTDPNLVLSWKVGLYSVWHTVYFGENSADIEAGIPGTFKGHFAETTFVPDGLEFDKTYYWRVDECADYSRDKGAVWSFSTRPTDPNLAHCPKPLNEAIHPDNWATLSWTPGLFADSHDVYFGTNLDDVDKGTNYTFICNQDEMFLVVGFEQFIPVLPEIVLGATYYWRIDEVNNFHPDSPWKGNLWSFTIAPKEAYSPDPGDGAEFINPNVSLFWKPGFRAKSHTVYFGDNFNDVSEATGNLSRLKTTYDTGPLESGKTYYWRVDEFDGITTYKGRVWSFSTRPADPNLAVDPAPTDAALWDATWVCISWSAGRHAVSHDVYFGENFYDVYNGTGDTFKGNLSVLFWITGFPRYAYSPGLIPGTTYYWRIDEVNDLHPDSPWKGNVWSFWIPSVTAYDPIPADGAEFIDPNTTLSWTAGFNVKLHTLYLGENLDDVEAGTGGTSKGSFSETSYIPDSLESGKTYYWRIDEFDGYTTHKGEIWSFTTSSVELVRGEKRSAGGISQ